MQWDAATNGINAFWFSTHKNKEGKRGGDPFFLAKEKCKDLSPTSASRTLRKG
jgi:hypothetical protein